MNLVDFDALWGHRRNVQGYAEELELFREGVKNYTLKVKKDGHTITIKPIERKNKGAK